MEKDREVRFAGLDGLRGIAAMLVVFNHLPTTVKLNHGAGWVKALDWISGFGWMGVDIFFVLSGFLITGILLNNRKASNYFSVFYAHRTLRIFPAYYLLLLIVTVLIPYLFPALHAAYSYPGKSWPYWFFLSDLWIANSWLHMAWIRALGPTWSLAVEEQFYIAWSLMIFFFCRPLADEDARRRTVAMALALLAFCLVSRWLLVDFAVAHYPTYLRSIYYFGPTHMDGLCVGIVARAFYDKPELRSYLFRFSRSWVLWLLLFAGVVWLDMPHYRNPGESNFLPNMLRLGFLFLSLLSCAVMARAILVDGAVRRVLENRVLKRLGDWSYFIYLYHFLLGYMVVLSLAHFGAVLPGAVVIALQIALVISLAALSQRYFEGPIRRLKRFWVFDDSRREVLPAAAS